MAKSVPMHALGPLGFGGSAIGNLYRPMADSVARDTVRAVLDAGIGYVDTAPHYGFGLAEKRLGAALAEFDSDQRVIVSTKIGRRLDPVPGKDLSQIRQGFVSPEPVESVFDYSYDAVMRSWEASRMRLRRDRIDILYVHDLGALTHGADHTARFAEFINGGYRALSELRDGAAIGAIGLGVNEWEVCEQALAHGDFDAIMLAGRYTLLEQAALDSFLPSCVARGVSVVIGGPYNSGILAHGVKGAGPFQYDYGVATADIVDRVRRIEAVCDTHGVPLAAAALQFPLAHPAVVSVVPGMNGPHRVAEAVRLMDYPIPPALWTDLRRAGVLHPAAPTP